MLKPKGSESAYSWTYSYVAWKYSRIDMICVAMRRLKSMINDHDRFIHKDWISTIVRSWMEWSQKSKRLLFEDSRFWSVIRHLELFFQRVGNKWADCAVRKCFRTRYSNSNNGTKWNALNVISTCLRMASRTPHEKKTLYDDKLFVADAPHIHCIWYRRTVISIDHGASSMKIKIKYTTAISKSEYSVKRTARWRVPASFPSLFILSNFSRLWVVVVFVWHCAYKYLDRSTLINLF